MALRGGVLLALALLGGCASAPGPPEINAPIEVVVHEVLKKQIFATAAQIHICFGPRNLDLYPDIVRELSTADPRIVPCKGLELRDFAVHVRSFTKTAGDRYVVHAGYWCGLLCADDTEFTVQKRDGAWVITSAVFQWIS